MIAPATLADAFVHARGRVERRTAAKPSPLVQYQRDPLGFCYDVFGIRRESLEWSLSPAYEAHTWDGTVDPLATVLLALARGQHVGVESGTGTGKTFTAALAGYWWLACWEDAQAYATATKEDQIRYGVWKEMERLWPLFAKRFPAARKGDLWIQMAGTDAWSWNAITASVKAEEKGRSATKVQGIHAEHLLMIFDEMPGINPAIAEAVQNTLGGSHNLMLGLGNPDHQLDPLHRWCLRRDVTHVRIASTDNPNVVTGDESIMPGATGRALIEAIREENGVDSRRYQTRVRGVSPEQSSDAMIHLAWCRAAAVRGQHAEWVRAATLGRTRSIGLDVAHSEGGDRAAVAEMWGPHVVSVVSRPCPDVAQLAYDVWGELHRPDRAAHERVPLDRIGVDPVGVGAGTVDVLDQLAGQRVVQRLNGALAAPTSLQRAEAGDGGGFRASPQRFRNLRAAMWWQLRDDLQHGRISLPADELLFQELTIVTYSEPGGVTTVDPKDDIRAKLGRSPDRADAIVYANWLRDRTPGPPAPIVGAEHMNLGFVTTPSGKRRPATLRDRHPGFQPTPADGSDRPWKDWTTRR